MEQSLRERFARLGPIQAIDLKSSGFPGVLVLRRPRDVPKTVDGALILARRGATCSSVGWVQPTIATRAGCDGGLHPPYTK